MVALRRAAQGRRRAVQAGRTRVSGLISVQDIQCLNCVAMKKMMSAEIMKQSIACNVVAGTTGKLN
jgi:hypothetical protein